MQSAAGAETGLIFFRPFYCLSGKSIQTQRKNSKLQTSAALSPAVMCSAPGSNELVKSFPIDFVIKVSGELRPLKIKTKNKVERVFRTIGRHVDKQVCAHIESYQSEFRNLI